MSLSLAIAQWLDTQPGRRATRAQLRAQFPPSKVESALQHCRSRGLVKYICGKHCRTDVEIDPRRRVLQIEQPLDDAESHRFSDMRFAALIGAQRYEDVKTVRPAALWRGLPPPATSSTAPCCWRWLRARTSPPPPASPMSPQP